MNSESKKTIAESLEADEKLLQYMPYLLQDLWALGSSVEQITQIFTTLSFPSNKINVLDLACGKGAVSVNLASKYGYNITGIDAMPEFIDEANKYAQKYKVEYLCKFIVDDILVYSKNIHSFDAVILASLGGIFGSIMQTISTLRNQVKIGGYIIIDDGYFKNKTHANRKGYEHYKNYYDTKNELTSAGDKIIAEISTTEYSKKINDEYIIVISKRCDELIIEHPDIKSNLENYLEMQKKECEFLEKEIEGIIWVIKKS